MQNGSFESTTIITFSINYQFDFECDFQSEKNESLNEKCDILNLRNHSSKDIETFSTQSWMKFREQHSSFKCGHFQAGYF